MQRYFDDDCIQMASPSGRWSQLSTEEQSGDVSGKRAHMTRAVILM